MSDTVITALIMTAGTIICQLLINQNNRKKQHAEDVEKEKKRAVEQAVKDEHLENRLSSIEAKLDIHNGYAEKLGEIQTDIAVIKTKVEIIGK